MAERRWDAELGWMRHCSTCREWWPDDAEFFKPVAAGSHAKNQCRACIAEKASNRPTPLRPYRHGSAIDIEAKKARERARKAAVRRDPIFGDRLRARRREAQHRYYEKNREKELARALEYRNRLRGGPPKPGVGRPRLFPEAEARAA